MNLDQNLLRELRYFSSSSFFNWISVRGSVYHEAGPFTLQDLSSNDVGTQLEFTVGRPWGKTAFVTGYTRRNLTFSPQVRQFFTTSTYAGITRKFGEKLTRDSAGRVHPLLSCAGHIDGDRAGVASRRHIVFQPNHAWSVNGEFAYTRGRNPAGLQQFL